MSYKGFHLVSGKDNIVAFPEADSQTFYKYAPVGLSSGQVVALSDAAEDDIFGIALRDSNNDTNNELVDVMVITPEQRWKAHLKATATNNTPSSISRGAGYKLDLTNGHWTIDGDTGATEGKGFVIESYESSDASTEGAEVVGRFGRLACLAIEG